MTRSAISRDLHSASVLSTFAAEKPIESRVSRRERSLSVSALISSSSSLRSSFILFIKSVILEAVSGPAALILPNFFKRISRAFAGSTEVPPRAIPVPENVFPMDAYWLIFPSRLLGSAPTTRSTSFPWTTNTNVGNPVMPYSPDRFRFLSLSTRRKMTFLYFTLSSSKIGCMYLQGPHL